ncbi:unnamed protein product [Arabis nemorensis]|uniref:MADS-box domain-containing protein n=1 Tax=Arabis nemorensis TaxID=586526 RepID=A0A565BUA6_9BRAS|nr:unnamed protein product [Arabis nemorensis]
MDSSSSATEKKKPKLSVRKQTRFKKQPSSKTKTTNLCMREQTLLNKAYELSTLCDIEVCVIYYGPNGELIKTYPEDQSKVRDMSERFIKLSDVERRKKSTNLSQFLTKNIKKEKQTSLDKNDNKFSLKVLEMERSLETRLQVLQDKLRFLSNKDQTEPDQSLEVASMTKQSNNFTMNELPSSLINNPLITHQQQQGSESLTNHHLMSGDVYNSGGFAIDSSNQNQNKYSIFLYDHDKDTFTQLSDSASSFGQGLAPYNNLMSTDLLGAQGFGVDGIGLRSCSNNNIPTQNPLVQPWNQTPFYGGDPMMFSSYN